MTNTLPPSPIDEAIAMSKQGVQQRDAISDIVTLTSSDRVFSDIHIQEDEPVMIKTPTGWTVEENIFPYSREAIRAILSTLDPDWESTIINGSINRPIDLEHWRLRVNAYLSQGGTKISMSIRKTPRKPMPFQKLGLPHSVNLMLEAPRGIILVGGATGMGKTTTIAAIIDRINITRPAHIITVEDPIEYVMERKRSIFSQREVGVDCKTYFEGVKDAMRQCPDVVVIGEIRDRATAETALIAAESGHLVIASMHANTSVGAISKLLGFFGDNERTSKVETLQGCLVGAIGQILLPSIDGKSSVLASELMFNQKGQLSKVIGDKDALQSAFERADDGVSQTFNQSLFELVKSNRISDITALAAVVYNQNELYEQIQRFRKSSPAEARSSMVQRGL